MDCTLDEPYISQYDRKRGRKKKYNTPEELAQAKRETAQKFREENYEYVQLQKQIQYTRRISTSKARNCFKTLL